MKKILLVFLTILFGLNGCGSIRKNNLNSESVFKKLSFEKYGTDTVCAYNPSGTYILCKRVDNDSIYNPYRKTDFFVFSNEEKKIVYEDVIAGAQISWRNDTLLNVKQQKGIISSTTDSGKMEYFIDFKNQNMIPVDKKPHYNK